jgi:hypothetical protein
LAAGRGSKCVWLADRRQEAGQGRESRRRSSAGVDDLDAAALEGAGVLVAGAVVAIGERRR